MSYTVAEEFIVLRDGAAVHYSDVGSTVELSDAEAAELIAEGKVTAPGPWGAPEVFVPTGSTEADPSTVAQVVAEEKRARARRRGEDSSES